MLPRNRGLESGPDPLTPAERAALVAVARPRRSLPVLADWRQAPGPLASSVRAVDQEDRPVYAIWELTLACDLACRHCGSRAGQPRPDELTTQEALDLVGQMAALGVREVTLIGGEAYLHDGWTAVIAEIRRHGMQSTMVTGGRGWDSERARAAKEAGLQSIAVSIDGTAVTHDRLRGLQGAHAAASSAIRESRRAGLQVAVNTQVNRLSLPDLPAILELILASGAHGWQVQLTVPAGRAADEPEVLLQPQDLLQLFPMLAELKLRCDSAGVKLIAGSNVGYFGPLAHILRSYNRCKHGGSCGAGRDTLGIESNGDIKGCPSMPSDRWVGGNVREHRLVDIWERSRPLRHMRDWTEDELWGYCRGCYYADVCRGGCSWMATALFGRPGNNPYCHHRVLELQRQGKRERLVRVAAAPGFSFDHARWDIVLEPEETP